MIGSELLRYKTDQLYLIADTETEGLSLGRSRPWQISYAVCTLKEVLSIKVRHLNWPLLSVSPEAARITRFDMASHLSIAEDPAVVLGDFEPLLYDPKYIVVGHNWLGFDAYVVQTWRRLCGRQGVDWSYLPRTLDTNALSKAYQKQWKPDRENMWAWQYRCLEHREKGLKSSLGAMARLFEVPYDERFAHDAAYDTRVNHGVLKGLVWGMEV